MDETGFHNPIDNLFKNLESPKKINNPINPMNQNGNRNSLNNLENPMMNMNNINNINDMNNNMMNQNNMMMNPNNMMMNLMNNKNNMGMNPNNMMMNPNLEESGMIPNNMMMNLMNNQNNMGMNDSQLTGMNTMMSQMMNMSQTNVMGLDENTLRIKEIIKPYEDRIKEQEEVIRKNTFQLTILREKLKEKEKENKKLKMNNMQMQMNNMNNMNNNMNFNNLDNDIIYIYFQYGMDPPEKIKCLDDELFESVINRFCNKNMLIRNSLSFIFNSPIVNTFMPVSEIGLGNNSIITVLEKTQYNFNMNNPMNNNMNNNMVNSFENMNDLNNNNFGMGMNNVNMNNLNNNLGMGMNNDNLNNLNKQKEDIINLIFNYRGKRIIIYLKESSTVSEALEKFFDKEGIEENDYEKFNFLYNDKKLLLGDDTPLKNIFLGIGYIDVNEIN